MKKDRKDKDKRKKDGKDREESLKSIREEYLALVITDPFLPKELLPSNWAFSELKNIIRKL